MKKILINILILTNALQIIAQKKLAGVYDNNYREFIPADTGVLVKEFKEGLAPYMIKGINPFDLKKSGAIEKPLRLFRRFSITAINIKG